MGYLVVRYFVWWYRDGGGDWFLRGFYVGIFCVRWVHFGYDGYGWQCGYLGCYYCCAQHCNGSRDCCRRVGDGLLRDLGWFVHGLCFCVGVW